MATPEPGAAARLRFTKMHGAGNDFVVLDVRGDAALARRLAQGDPALCRALADRHTGVGCDQIMVIGPARGERAVAAYAIRNADGSASTQCGNGARCVAAWLARDGAAAGTRFAIESPVGEHEVEAIGDGHYRLALGRPRFEPVAVPLHGFDRAQDPYTLHLGGDPVRFGAVSMGNPHAVIEVDDVATAPVETLGRALQDSDAFPESANVGFAQVLAPDHIALRVYERGAGETLACGSGACAAAAVLMRRGRVAREVVVSLPGGELRIAWPGDGAEVTMSGPTRFVFDGEWLQ